ncbi:hypothetical protein [Nocardioides sp.]|uniref:hypothetical protein n=1 Tax=Nocardioides sp. TaxID=35761 RepID=UPI0027323307|nr:hypothetical protein [Nocardioides sp.]
MASDPWGVSSKVGTEDLLLGTQLWCAEGEPHEVTEVSWNEADGVEVVDFVTLSQPAQVGRIGLLAGDIDTTQEISERSRVISTPCDSPPEAGSDPVTYLVLQLRLADPDEVGVASGLQVRTGDSSSVEPLTVVLCPEAYDTCDESAVE